MQLLLKYEVGVCCDCGEPIYFGDDYSENSDGGVVCRSCRSERWVRCTSCGELVPVGDSKEDSDGNPVCGRCSDIYYSVCSDCGNIVRNEDGEYCGGEFFCDDCAPNWTECAECGNAVRLDRRIDTAEGDSICPDCYDENYFTCEGCGEVFRNENGYYRSGRAATYCEECYSGSSEDYDGIFSYHDFTDSNDYEPQYAVGERPEWGTPASLRPRLYGVELECDGGDFRRSAFDEWTDDGYLIHFEHDGSLSDSGVECISQPCSLKFHQNEMGWEKILAKFVEQGFKSHNTDCCGLHVHIGRRELSPVTISKMDIFINHGRDFFQQIARRPKFYRNGSNDAGYDVGKRLSARKGRRHATCDDRYQAVNTTNSETVEIRIFKGTLKCETLIGTLEMVDAMIRFLGNLPIGRIYRIEENILGFVDFCGENRVEYPHLIPMMNRLVRRGTAVPNIAFWNGKIENSKKRKETRECA